MTEPPEPERSMAIAILSLRHDILSNGRLMSWDDVRGRIRSLIGEGRPSPQERIQLLDLYDTAASMVERRLRPDAESFRRLGYQRASDTMMFLIAEVRDQGAADPLPTVASILQREIDAGRLRTDQYLRNVMSWLVQEIDRGDDPTPPGVAEGPAAFSFPPPVSRPPASPSSPPGP